MRRIVIAIALFSAGQALHAVDGVGLYLEDMILVTATGAEVLSMGLPYSATEIERAVRRKRKSR